MIVNDPVPASQASVTPLFRHADGSPLLYRQLHSFIKDVMERTGHNPNEYGTSSLRSGAATAASAIEGVSDTQLQNLGYWASNIFSRYVLGLLNQTILK